MGGHAFKRPARYLIVGAWNTVFGLALFSILYLVLGQEIGYIAVLTVAQIVAVLQSHATQRFFVWKSHAPYRPELLRFSAVYAAAFLANVLLLALAVDAFRLPVLPSQWSIGGALIVLTYFLQRAWTFRQPTGRPSDLIDGPEVSVSDRAGRGTS